MLPVILTTPAPEIGSKRTFRNASKANARSDQVKLPTFAHPSKANQPGHLLAKNANGFDKVDPHTNPRWHTLLVFEA